MAPRPKKATKAELRHRKFVRERTKQLLKRLDQFEAWMDAFEKRYSTNAMLSKLQAIGNRVTYFENHSRMKDFSSLFIRMGQLEAAQKTVSQFTQEEIGVLRRIVVAAVREPYDVRARLHP